VHLVEDQELKKKRGRPVHRPLNECAEDFFPGGIFGRIAEFGEDNVSKARSKRDPLAGEVDERSAVPLFPPTERDIGRKERRRGHPLQDKESGGAAKRDLGEQEPLPPKHAPFEGLLMLRVEEGLCVRRGDFPPRRFCRPPRGGYSVGILVNPTGRTGFGGGGSEATFI
jgi:hypothetical protein